MSVPGYQPNLTNLPTDHADGSLPSSPPPGNDVIASGGIVSTFGAIKGDSLTYDPSVATSSGSQSALSAHIGEETLTKFSGGAATVGNDNSPNIVSDENGKLYGVGADGVRKEFGSDSSWTAKHEAAEFLGGGKHGKHEVGNLIAVAHGNLESSRTVRDHEQEFGAVDNKALVNKLNSLIDLSQASTEAANPNIFKPFANEPPISQPTTN